MRPDRRLGVFVCTLTSAGPRLAKAKKGVKPVTQEFALVAIADIVPHPKNPNQGDIGAITESLEELGFFGTVILQKDREGPGRHRMLGGWHRLEAERMRGSTTVPAMLVTCTDAQADKILAADNGIAARAQRDPAKLAELLQGIIEDGGNLTGTGYDGDDLDALIASIGDGFIDGVTEEAPDESGETGKAPEDDRYKNQFGCIIICDSEQHQQLVYEDLRQRGYNVRVVVT